MITLITGVPGAGKTLRAVEWIERLIREGRQVYAQIDGLSMPGVLPAPDDWRETPDGSVVVYDEAQRVYGAEGRGGRSDRTDIQALETHRHTGHDLILITQHPGLIHSHVRRLVGRHEHVMRVFGSARVVIAWRDRAFDIDSRSERSSAITEQWAHPARLFGCYKSATIHVSQARLPGKIKLLAGFALLLLGVVAVSAYNFFSGPSLDEQVSVSVDGNIDRSEMSASSSGNLSVIPAKPWPVRAVVSGCISTLSRCQCYTSDGLPIEQEVGECMRFITQPLPIQIGVSRESAPSRSDSDLPESAAQRASGGSELFPTADEGVAAVSRSDPVAMSGGVDPVAMSDPGNSSGGVSHLRGDTPPARLGNVGGGTRPATW